jgi:CubicO group peptidase (beta-lactamase class C family)
MRNKLFSGFLMGLLIILSSKNTSCQSPSLSPESNSYYLFSLVDSLLLDGYQESMFPGAGVSLLIGDSLRLYSIGNANLESLSDASIQTRYQLGSIGKLMTAIAVLQQLEQGRLDLNADISLYIQNLTLKNKYTNNPITLHCLLTHSCGFNDVNIGYMAENVERVLPLEQFIEQYNPGLFQVPGTDINYSNFSYALAGFIVQEASGIEFSQYVDDNILDPLKMENTTLEFPVDYEINESYSNAYKKTSEGFEEAFIYPRHAVPAGSLVSTPEDMGVFLRALLTRDTTLLSALSWELLYTQQFTNHPLLNGYSYGLEHQNVNGMNAWAKGGMLPGMLSHILIVPDKYAAFTVVNTDDDGFSETFFKTLFDKTQKNIIPQSELNKQISTTKYTGVFRDKRYNRNTEENIVSLFRGQFTVYNNQTHDSLVVYHNGRWHSYVPVERGVFQNTDLPFEYLVYKEDKKGNIKALYRNINIGGLSVPVSYEKTLWYNSPSFINDIYGIIPLFTFTGLLFILASLFVRVIRIWIKHFFKSKLLPARFLVLFSAIILLLLIHTYFVPYQLITNVQDFLLGYPASFKLVSLLGYLLIPLVLGLGISMLKIWKNHLGSLFSRIYLSLVEVSLIIHLVFLHYWNFY